MQNVTAACSTILFNYLNPDQKAHYFNDYSLSDISKRKGASIVAMPSSFFSLIEPTSKISALNDFWTTDFYFIKITISFYQDL